jgi:hypothetical protein
VTRLWAAYRHAGAELHRRFATQAFSVADERTIAGYLFTLAARHRDLPPDAGLLWFGFLAASTRRDELSRLIRTSPLLDPRQRDMLEAFGRLLATPRGMPRTWHGRPSIDAFLATEGYDARSRSDSVLRQPISRAAVERS